MLQMRSRRRDQLHANAEITMTNLIDVAFVLLIIFMITAPILQGGIEVSLPKASSAPINSQEGVIVSIKKDGTIYIGEVPVQGDAEFSRVFAGTMNKQSKKFAYLKGDKEVTHGRVMEIIGLMNKLDVATVGMVVEPLVESKR